MIGWKMNEPIESIDYKGYVIEIHFDNEPPNCRTDWDNVGKMICFHSRYDLGDEHDYNSDDYDGWDELHQAIMKDGGIVSLPLYIYDHGGITMSTGQFSCPWDSGQVGWIIATRENVEKMMGWGKITKGRQGQLIDILDNEVKAYDQYLTGQVYGFKIIDPSGSDVDSCWGYYGEKKDCISEAESSIDSMVEHDRKTKQEETKQSIKAGVPIQYRGAK